MTGSRPDAAAGTTSPPPPGPDTVIDAARLRVAIARLSRRLRRHVLAGLTPTQLSALATVERAGPLRLGDLAAAEGIAPAGRAVLERIRQESTTVLAESLRMLTSEQLAALAAALPALEQLAGTDPPGGAGPRPR